MDVESALNEADIYSVEAVLRAKLDLSPLSPQ